MTSGYVEVSFVYIGWMPFLATTLDIADPLFALGITPWFLSAPRRGAIKTQLAAVYS